jgi:hypothetical protein
MLDIYELRGYRSSATTMNRLICQHIIFNFAKVSVIISIKHRFRWISTLNVKRCVLLEFRCLIHYAHGHDTTLHFCRSENTWHIVDDALQTCKQLNNMALPLTFCCSIDTYDFKPDSLAQKNLAAFYFYLLNAKSHMHQELEVCSLYMHQSSLLYSMEHVERKGKERKEKELGFGD